MPEDQALEAGLRAKASEFLRAGGDLYVSADDDVHVLVDGAASHEPAGGEADP